MAVPRAVANFDEFTLFSEDLQGEFGINSLKVPRLLLIENKDGAPSCDVLGHTIMDAIRRPKAFISFLTATDTSGFWSDQFAIIA